MGMERSDKMNRAIKFRYTVKMPNGLFLSKDFAILQIEAGLVRLWLEREQAAAGVECLEEGFRRQFIGHLDKHGKEIYEGDIWVDKEGSKCRHVVEWKTSKSLEHTGGMGGPSMRYRSGFEHLDPYGSNNIIIIGNIVENPELLIDRNKKTPEPLQYGCVVCGEATKTNIRNSPCCGHDSCIELLK